MSSSRRGFLKGVAAAGLAHALTPHVQPSLAGPQESAQAWPASPFLHGNYAPVHEEITVDDLPVIGQLPGELRGMYVRNGPNPQFPPRGHYHWFDGDGMLHGVYIEDGKASYRNRYVRTAGFEAEREAGRALWGGLLDPPDLDNILKTGQPFKNAANTALVWHDGRLLALWEGGPPHEIRVPGLETAGLFDYDGKLQHPFTAHPKVDPQTGEMLFFGYSVTAPYLQYSVVDRQGNLASTTPIELPRAVMMHDFAVTPNYAIFMDLPETFNLLAVQSGGSMLSFQPQLGARFGILPRHGQGDQVRWFEAEPCFVFHTLNAYEDGDEIVLEACRMNEFPDVLGSTDPSADPDAPGEAPPLWYRWRFNLADGTTREEQLDDLPIEFPRINDALLGQATRYGYAMTLDSGGLIRYDRTSGARLLHRHGEGRTGGEGVFVPRRADGDESDGWLLTYVYDQSTDKSELVVVDAGDLTAPPIARVMLPARVPYGFHGTWISADDLAAVA